MNLVILVVWTLFVLIPQFVVEPSLRKQYFPCIHRNDSRNCTRNTTVHLVIGNCTTPPPHSLTVATLCSDPTTKVLTAPRAAKNTSTCPLGPGEWYQCPAYKPSFISPVDLVTGRGGYNDTALFLGHYVNFTEYNGISYNRPVAILVSTAVVFGVSVIMLMIKYIVPFSIILCDVCGVYMCVCASVYVFVCMYVCMCMCCIYIDLVCVCVCECVCGHVCVYVCIYV